MLDPILFQLPEQLSLFEAPRVRPRWKDLPPDIRKEAGRLLTKMLRDHWERQLPAESRKEATDE